MELNANLKKIKTFISKYRYAFIIVVIGLLMMMFPSKQEEPSDESWVGYSSIENIPTMEERLTEILSKIRGAGDVQVMLTTLRGEEVIFQTDEDSQSDSDRYSIKKNVVTVTDGTRNESGLIRQTNPPSYLGAIIVCSGADDPTVQLAIVEAVSKVTGIGANRISVLKMK